MQNSGYKFISLIILKILLFSQAAYSQSVIQNLQEADSLFKQQSYTQSLVLYEAIYNESQQATPAMLLKMAYSLEAMGNLSKALVYLHDYYRMTSDRKVLKKMNELAQINGLQGYEISDFQKFVKVTQNHRVLITLLLLSLCVLLLLMIFRKCKKHGEKSGGLGLGIALTIGITILFVNFTDLEVKGIVTSENAYVMSGPSAAAELVEVIGQGHKVELLRKKDIWYEITWRGKRAYIRENNLQKLF